MQTPHVLLTFCDDTKSVHGRALPLRIDPCLDDPAPMCRVLEVRYRLGGT
jgi:hypothetical protein